MHFFARENLAEFASPDDRPRVLLEGDWNPSLADDISSSRLALDRLVDGRFERIDVEAERIAERLASCSPFADCHALRLRYAVVKWLRPIVAWRAFFAARASRQIDLYVSTSVDDREYIAAFQALAESDGLRLRVHEHSLPAIESPVSLPPNRPWRRLLSFLAAKATRCPRFDDRPRVLFCGNPRILDPICNEALRRRSRAAWLFDRFAVHAWRRWALRGVPVFSCDETRATATSATYAWSGSASRSNEAILFDGVNFDGVDLLSAFRAWESCWRGRLEENQSRLERRVAEQVAAYRPTHVVVDQDATPLARLVVAAARNHGATSFVVQHGVCGVRFGFAPLHADRFLAADEASRSRMLAWNVPTERIDVVGSIDRARCVEMVVAERQEFGSDATTIRESLAANSEQERTILFIGTTPPRDHRPDAVTFHFTTAAYRRMLQAVIDVVGAVPNARLLIRRHPRSVGDPILEEVLQGARSGLCRFASTKESVGRQIAWSACVLSCGSSAGIEAATAGAPVVQILPEGSGDMISAEPHGLLGTARSVDELRQLLAAALRRGWRSPTTLDSTSATAARIVDCILQTSDSVRRSIRPTTHVAEVARV